MTVRLHTFANWILRPPRT